MHLYIILLFSLIGYAQQEKDYKVAQKVLQHLHEYKEFRLISTPNNEYIELCLNGFYAHSTYENKILDYRDLKFTFNPDPVIKWSNQPEYLGKDLSDKIFFIEDFETAPKISLRDFQEAKSYVALSNPAFSNDGKYAIIFYETFSNTHWGDAEGFVIIFKKERGEWVYQTQFTAYLT